MAGEYNIVHFSHTRIRKTYIYLFAEKKRKETEKKCDVAERIAGGERGVVTAERGVVGGCCWFEQGIEGNIFSEQVGGNYRGCVRGEREQQQRRSDGMKQSEKEDIQVRLGAAFLYNARASDSTTIGKYRSSSVHTVYM